MIDIALLREQPEQVKKGIAAKGADPALVDVLRATDKAWRAIVAELDALRMKQHTLGDKYQQLSGEEKESLKVMKEQIKTLEERTRMLEMERAAAWRQIPNLPLAEVPVGGSEAENLTLREVGKKPKFDFAARDYLTLAENLGIIDMARAGKVSGSRFGYLLGAAARMEFGLIQLAVQTVDNGAIIKKIIKKNNLNIPATPFLPVVPPVLVNAAAMRGMGYLERGGEEVYYLPADDMYLVGTSEQSLGPMHREETLAEKNLPRRYLGFSTCFRREAGSYGRDTRGILRVHQFDKLEMFSLVPPAQSRAEHRLLLGVEEYLMQALELPYRVLNICTADLGDPAAAKFDIEAWLPGQNGGRGEYRETHSTSNTTDFQSRRLNIRYQSVTADSRPEFVHLLNGTAFAIGRMLIAIMENYQTARGEIKVPKVLQPYVGEKIIRKEYTA